MATVYNYDENGEMTEIFVNPFDKLATIKAKLEKDLQTIKRRYEANENSQYPRKLNFNTNITSRIFIICSGFEKIPYKYAIDIELQTIKDYSSAFMDFWQWILSFYPDFVCDKNIFPAFLGISASAYSYLLTNTTDPDILNEILYVHNATGTVEMVSAQSGTSKEKSTMTKLSADTNGVGYGMDLKTMPENVTINNNLGLGASEVKKQLESILGVGLIEGKGKK